jgi:hypothetical protein
MEDKQNHAGGCLGFLTIIGNVLFLWVFFYAIYKVLTSSDPGVKLVVWILVIFFIINMYLKYG